MRYHWLGALEVLAGKIEETSHCLIEGGSMEDTFY